MKHWKKIKKREKRERKYIIRFLKLHHVRTTIPPKWDMIHVVKYHDPIRTMDDIKTVALKYGRSNEESVTPTELMSRLNMGLPDLVSYLDMDAVRAARQFEMARPSGMPDWVRDGLMPSF